MTDNVQAPRYSAGAILIHWATAIAVVFQLSLGWRMEDAPDAEIGALFQLHKSVGITILLLTLARIVWRVTHKPPPSTAHGWEHALARTVHTLFYVGLIGLPLTGWIIISTGEMGSDTMLWGLVPWPDLPLGPNEALGDAAGDVHKLLVWVAVALVALHLAGVAKHLLIDHDSTLHRMAPGARRLIDWRVAAILIGLAAAFAGARLVPASAAPEALPDAEEAAASPTDAPVTPVDSTQ